MSKSVLAVSVHPDDETLGAGGTLLKHLDQGDDIYWLLLSSGNEYQEQVIEEVAEEFQFKQYFNLEFEDTKLDDISKNQLIPQIASVFNKVEPNILYIPNRSDVHSDHRAAFESIIPATKNFRFPFIEKIMMCEVLSETEFAPALPENYFNPTVFTDISEYFERKIEIVKLFESEILSENQPRSISSVTAHNRYRGSRIGVKYAEAFQLLLEIR
ncbi:PIG-L deacetylase family protein [Fodinibius halophilus]|uniref:PIG-L family deacetylase n=1 Tax=Fodinibius halophilus TaxID=1736908 RepID=A0A6M1TBM3_9BACT|nr:PIG-L family deacetylase [Fodinibius halophilus]NGP88324.1 hypothetical protein [Fodinibius halophilus]